MSTTNLNCHVLIVDDSPILRAAIKKGEEIEVTLHNYKKDGELFHNRLVVKPLKDDRGNLVYFLGVQYDITEQVNAQDEISKLTKELELSAR